jgi:hypothetical protein
MAGEFGRDEWLPLMPAGIALFDALPAGAVVLDALAPAVGKGVITVRDGASAGLIVIREGRVVDIAWIADGRRTYGEEAMVMIRRSSAATVSATRLTDEALDLVGPLMYGDPCYADLRLEWVDWARLLDDLRERGNTYVIELEMPSGRGVAVIKGGRQVATYTDSHPAIGEPDLLDALAAGGTGTIRVSVDVGARRAPLAAVNPAAASPADIAPSAEPAPTVALMAGAPPSLASDPDYREGAAAPQAPAVPQFEPFDDAIFSPNWSQPRDPESIFGSRFDDDQRPAPLITFGAPHPATSSGDVATLLPQLRSLVRERLQRSSGSVEDLLDSAATDGQTVAWLADRVRVMTVRGFMHSTLEHLADEMLALAVQPPR